MSMAGGLNPDAMLQQAVRLHNAGELTGAADIYRQLLRQFPSHVQLLNVLGTLELQRGEAKKCVLLLGRSLGLSPEQPLVLVNRAVALQLLGRVDEALEALGKAVALDAENADAWHKRAGLLVATGHTEEALICYGRVLALQPQNAAACYDRGTVRLHQGQLIEAVADFDRALAVDPAYLHARINRGSALLDLGRSAEALADFDRALSQEETCAEAHLNRGRVLEKLERGDEAMVAYERAIALNPALPSAHYNLGVLLIQKKKYDLALAAMDRTIALDPRYGDAYNNRGNVLISLDRLDEALASLNRAIALNPKNASAHTNRGNVLRDLGRNNEAILSYDRAIAVDPDHAEAYANKSISLLQAGNFTEGWKLYEWRWKCEGPREAFRKFSTATVYQFDETIWHGEAAEGKTLLVHAEQGLGDTLHFCRYVSMLPARGLKVLFEVPDALRPLMQHLPGVAQGNITLVGLHKKLPPFDLHCPLMTLPFAFGTTVETIPAHIPYLQSDPEKEALMAARLGEKTRPRVGLVWSGNPDHSNDRNRSIALSRLAPLFALPFEFHALQKVIRPSDAAALAASGMRSHCDVLNDFSDTAALVRAMDLVIAVDTSVAHLAGALGAPLWLMLTCVAEWRWMENRPDSPWYPSAELFRQPARGDWEGVAETVAERLLARFAT